MVLALLLLLIPVLLPRYIEEDLEDAQLAVDEALAAYRCGPCCKRRWLQALNPAAAMI